MLNEFCLLRKSKPIANLGFGLLLYRRNSGADVSSYTVAQIIALMSGVDGSIGQIPQNHFYALEVLRNNGTEQQKRKLYAEVLKGARFGNALAEFKTKNATQKQTALSQTEQGYVVNGE